MKRKHQAAGIAAALALCAVLFAGCSGGNAPDLNIVAENYPECPGMARSVNVIDLGAGVKLTGKRGNAVTFVTPELLSGYYDLALGDRVLLRQNEGLVSYENGWAVTAVTDETGAQAYCLRGSSGKLLAEGEESASAFNTGIEEAYAVRGVWYRLENGAPVPLFSGEAAPQFAAIAVINGKYVINEDQSGNGVAVYGLDGRLVYRRRLSGDEKNLGFCGPESFVIQRLTVLPFDAEKYDYTEAGAKFELSYAVVNLADGKETEAKPGFFAERVLYDEEAQRCVAEGYAIRKNATAETVLRKYFMGADFSVKAELYGGEQYYKLPAGGYLYRDGSRYTLLDKKGGQAAALGEVTVAAVTEQGLALFTDASRNQLRVVDAAGKEIALSQRFDAVGAFCGGYALAATDEAVYSLKADGTAVPLADDFETRVFEELSGCYALDTGTEYVFKDLAGKEIGRCAYAALPVPRAEIYTAAGKQFLAFASEGKLVEIVR